MSFRGKTSGVVAKWRRFSQANFCFISLHVFHRKLKQSEQFIEFLESFRFWDEDDYEYEILSVLLSSALAWTNVILAGKRDSRHRITSFSDNVLVAETSYQILKV